MLVFTEIILLYYMYDLDRIGGTISNIAAFLHSVVLFLRWFCMKGERMEDSILLAAAEEIEQSGPDFTMDNLAKRLKISKRTIYEKYRSKNEIVSGIFQLKIQKLIEMHEEILKNETLSLHEKLSAYFNVKSVFFLTLSLGQLNRVLEKYPEVKVEACAQVNLDWQNLEYFLREEEAAGRIKDADIDVILLLLRGAVQVMLEDPSRISDKTQISDTLSKGITMLLNGIKVV